VKGAAERGQETSLAFDLSVKEIYIEASPEIVFEFLTDPKKIVRWLEITAELEPRTGTFRVGPIGQHLIRGAYLGVIPNHRVVFTWKAERIGRAAPARSFSVAIELNREGQGTRLRLSHRMLEVESRDRHERGESRYMDRLKAACEDHHLDLQEDLDC
jgi:uncharacterized protein YndB with AHSA1/START domain